MFNNSPFYWQTLRKYIVAFGSMFSDFHIQRYDSDGSIVKVVPVALTYDTRQNFIQKFKHDNGISVQIQTYLPRITFALRGLTKSTTRQTNRFNKITQINADTSIKDYIYNPAPYDLQIEMSIWVKTADDGLQIIEQILPYFQPSLNVVVNEFPQFNITRDVPITIEDVDLEFDTEYDENSNEIIQFSLNFKMPGNIYPPIKDAKIIKEAYAELFYKDDSYSKFLEMSSSKVVPISASEEDAHDVVTDISDTPYVPPA